MSSGQSTSTRPCPAHRRRTDRRSSAHPPPWSPRRWSREHSPEWGAPARRRRHRWAEERPARPRLVRARRPPPRQPPSVPLGRGANSARLNATPVQGATQDVFHLFTTLKLTLFGTPWFPARSVGERVSV